MSFIDELFNFVLSSGIIQAIAGEANANEGLLALVGLTVTVTIFVGRFKSLRIPAAVLAITTLFATYAFLSPRDGEMATFVEPTRTTEIPQTNERVAEKDAQTVQPAPRSTASHRPTYRVTGVDCDDVLNVRSEPAVFSDGAIVGQLSCAEDRIIALGATRQIGFSEWWEIETPATFGWVNARYLLPNQARSARRSVTVCAPIQGAALTNDHSSSQCQIMRLSEGRNAESTWTGECDQQNRAHGLGISRTYTDVEQERRLTAVFFGRIQNGTSLSGILSRDGHIRPVCSDATGLSEPRNTTTRNTAKSDGIRGIDSGIAAFRQINDRKAEEFYVNFRNRLMSVH